MESSSKTDFTKFQLLIKKTADQSSVAIGPSRTNFSIIQKRVTYQYLPFLFH